MRLRETRKQFRTANQRLRRARWLFVWLARKDIEAVDPDLADKALERTARRMKEYGFYAEITCFKSCMFSILSIMHRQDCPCPRGSWSWHNWLDENDWSAYERKRKRKTA